MNDRELLELAAKAAGYDLYATWSEFGHFEGFRIGSINGDAWNAITDDGDALRLLVALREDLALDAASMLGCGNFAAWKADPNAATRRAIVRAAAEIGKAMP